LYENEAIFQFQVMTRRERMDVIYEHCKKRGWRFAVFGPAFLKKIYPDAYVTELSYDAGTAVFASSRLNLSTHVDWRNGYCNERDIRVTAAGAVLLTDPVPDFPFRDGKECVVLGNTALEIIRKLDEVLNPSASSTLNEIASGGRALTKQSFTWASWAEAFLSAIQQCPRLRHVFEANRLLAS
jgi:hypothetical protein